MKLMLLLFSSAILYCCGSKSINYSSDLPLGDSIWEEFSRAVLSRDTGFLLRNSLDSIKCVDCFPNDSELVSSKIVFSAQQKDLMHIRFLQSKKYSVYMDSILYINYAIKTRHSEEGGSNIIFMFVKRNQRFIFKGMITVP